MFHRPQAKSDSRTPESETFYVPEQALERWNLGLKPSASADENVIDMFDVVGEDVWSGGGISAKSVKAQLAAMAGPVTVNVNSPGGDLFEGLAIYEVLKAHPARVNVNVLGLAASAASIIAMAGSKLRIGKASFFMIHNCWSVVIGDAPYLQKQAADMAAFDASMAGIYADRSGQTKEQIAAWMNAETWFNGEQAVDNGLADALLPSDAVTQDSAIASAREPIRALRKAEMLMARGGATRLERRQLFKSLTDGMPSAAINPGDMPNVVADPVMPRADLQPLADEMRALTKIFK